MNKELNFKLYGNGFVLNQNGNEPIDCEWYFVIYQSKDGEYVNFVGGYFEERKEFYANFGLGGAVLGLKDAIAWISLDDIQIMDGMR